MDNDIFNDYAKHFAAITPYCMSEVYQEAARGVKGKIVDCGCGPCKLAPYLVGTQDMLAYTGIDYSREMVSLGRELLDKLNDDRCEIRCDSVENLKGEYDCAVSLQSYYAWPSPVKALTRIHKTLVPGGKLILATANHRLDIEALLQSASKDWLLNPLWEPYMRHNRQIAGNKTGTFESLDRLIGEVRGVGFEIVEAHSRFYEGGLNYIVAMK